MSFELPLRVVNCALDHLHVAGAPEPRIWPHGSQNKLDNGDFCFTLGMPSENIRRQLTIRFGATLEVFLPGDAYQQICQPQVVEAILSFWDGETKESNRVVHIRAEAVFPKPELPDLGNRLTPDF